MNKPSRSSMDNLATSPIRPEKGLAKPNWKQVRLFLGATFGLTYLLDLALWLGGGYRQGATAVVLQFQMLLPAFSAIALGLFAFKDSPLYQMRVNRERPRFFFYFFLVYTLYYLVGSLLLLVFRGSAGLMNIFSQFALLLMVVGLIGLIVLRVTSGREAFARVWLGGGQPLHWLLFGLGFILFYSLQAFLNYVFRLGHMVYLGQLRLPPEVLNTMPPGALLAILSVQTVLLGPFLGLLIALGEEYGWRGYLQSELVLMGKVKGVLLLGVIWGLWHAPVIAMGHNYPGYPVVGIFLMTGLTVGLSFVLGYVVLKTGSVLLAAYLHALNNQVWGFFVLVVYAPTNPVFSFGVGLYGILSLGLVALLLFLDPMWRKKETVAAPGG